MPRDIFFFNSRSAATKPGAGVHETIHPESTADYSHFANNPHWRRALSNFWISPFELDGHRWNTVEHYFQAQKLKIQSDDLGTPFEHTWLFTLFCLDCKVEDLVHMGDHIQMNPHLYTTSHAVATGDGSSARRYRKWQTLTKDQLVAWDSRKDDVMARAQFAKFSQSPTLRGILLATGTAELWHGAARQPAARMRSLEIVRAALRKGLTVYDPDAEDD